MQSLLSAVRDGYRPFQVVALGAPDGQPSAFPLLQDRRLVNGQPAVYVFNAPLPWCAFAWQRKGWAPRVWLGPYLQQYP